MLKTFCGLHGANVEMSTYNKDGQCKCLGCPGNWCQSCGHYKELLDESSKKNEIKLERCFNCLRQR